MNQQNHKYVAFIGHDGKLSSHLHYRTGEANEDTLLPTIPVYLLSELSLFSSLDRYRMVASLGSEMLIALERDGFFTNVGPPAISLEFYNPISSQKLPPVEQVAKFQKHAIQEMEYRNIVANRNLVDRLFVRLWNEASKRGQNLNDFNQDPNVVRIRRIMRRYALMQEAGNRTVDDFSPSTSYRSLEEMYEYLCFDDTNITVLQLEEINEESVMAYLADQTLHTVNEQDPALNTDSEQGLMLNTNNEQGSTSHTDNERCSAEQIHNDATRTAESHEEIDNALGSFFNPYRQLPLPIAPTSQPTNFQGYRNVLFVIDSLEFSKAGMFMVVFNRLDDWSGPVQELSKHPEHVTPISLQPDGMIRRGEEQLQTHRLIDVIQSLYVSYSKEDLFPLDGLLEDHIDCSRHQASVEARAEDIDSPGLMSIDELMVEFDMHEKSRNSHHSHIDEDEIF